MTDFQPRKYDNIFKLLSEHNFATNKSIPDDLLCTKCKHILIDACQVSCGCRYCRHCIDEMLAFGCLICPGDKEFCKDEQLSDIQRDHFRNKMILKLVVKCPAELCPYECELINMDDHLRLCSKKSAKCPFFGFGCNDDKLMEGKMDGHLQSEGYNHNKILIEMIENLMNEVNGLKENDRKYEKETQRNKDYIEILKENSKMKDETTVVMKAEIQRNQAQIALLKENTKRKDTTIAVIYGEINLIKMEKQEMVIEINNIKLESEKKMANLREEVSKEARKNLGIVTREINDKIEKLQSKHTQLIDGENKQQKKSIDSQFSWTVDQISDKRRNCTNITSPIFYPKINSYKMQLQMWNDADGDGFGIALYIHPGENDANLIWPYQGNVTIQITNNVTLGAFKSITQFSNILKPDPDSYKSCDPFEVSFNELASAGLIQDNYFIIECFVE